MSAFNLGSSFINRLVEPEGDRMLQSALCWKNEGGFADRAARRIFCKELEKRKGELGGGDPTMSPGI